MSELIRERASKIEELEAELEDQCRLNGIGSEREAKLLGEVDRLTKQRDDLLSIVDLICEQGGGMTHHTLMAAAALVRKIKGPCKKCGGQMHPGIATGQTWAAGIPDFPDQTIGITMSLGGPGKVVECLKCESCGCSVGK